MALRSSRRETVVVTGASAGVGRAIAVAYARRGARVALIARGREGLDAAALEVERAGGRALTLEVDVSDSAAVFAAAQEAERALGPVDVWVNNAMATVFGEVESVTPEEFRRVMEVTFLGYVHGALAALRLMKRRDRGRIVQVGSALAYRAIPLQGPYCAAKFAVRGFTESLRSELLHHASGIRLVAVHLPAVNTPQFDWSRTKMGRRHQPLGDIYEPEAIAEAIVEAARRGGREYWIGWSSVKTILGAMLAPGFLDRYLANAAYEQITDRGPPARDILFTPVDQDKGSRGSHGPGARSPMLVNPVAIRVGALIAAGALAAAGAWGLARIATNGTSNA